MNETCPNPTPNPTARRHDIDALRALAFLLVIVYHVGMYYVAGWGWHVKSPHAAEWLQWPMRLSNLWRMDLVFLVSGLSLALLVRRPGAGPWLLGRVVRLLLPLAFGMLVVVPYQAYAQGVANGAFAPGFGAFLLQYLTLSGHWSNRAFDGAGFGITWNHLWYLPYLLVYTALVALLMPVWRTRPAALLQRGFNNLRSGWLLLVPALPLLAWSLTLQPLFPPTHDLLHDGYLHAMYFTVFLYGWWMGIDVGLWRELERLRWHALVVALVSAVAFALLRTGTQADLGATLFRTAYTWCLIASILGHAHRHLNRPWRWLGWANESVYPWYLLHQTLIIALAVALAPLALHPLPESALLLGGTLLGCWVINDGLVRRIGWLRPMFGLKPRGGRQAQVAAELPASTASRSLSG